MRSYRCTHNKDRENFKRLVGNLITAPAFFFLAASFVAIGEGATLPHSDQSAGESSRGSERCIHNVGGGAQSSLSGGSPLSENVRQTLDDNNLRSQQSSDAPLDTCVDIGTQSSTSGGGPLLKSVCQASCTRDYNTQSLISGNSPLYKSAHHDTGVQSSPTSPENNF